MTQAEGPAELIVANLSEWRTWLIANEETSDGVWLVHAKKGVTEPTELNYQDALEEALCSGWIDGQRKGRDATTFLQRYTPRRKQSIWSARNVTIVARLIADGRFRERGHAEVERAKADGRWDNAYAGPATAQAPPELVAALAADPAAKAAYDQLNSTARFSALHPILVARTPETKARRIAKLVDSLSTER